MNTASPKRFSVCFWLNAPSHYQRDFLRALYQSGKVDLQIRYFSHWATERLTQKWSMPDFETYEKQVASPEEIRDIPNYQNFLHVVSGVGYQFNRELISILISENLKWMHWSEPYGLGVYQKAHFHKWLADLLLPIANIRLRRYAKILNSKSVAVLGQGLMSRANFISWGVREDKIEDLYYCGNQPSLTRTPEEVCFPQFTKNCAGVRPSPPGPAAQPWERGLGFLPSPRFAPSCARSAILLPRPPP